jgi:ribosomal protein L40E
MQCPDCHTYNPAQARFCMGCGRLLINGQVCRQCNALLPQEARYCYHCGAFIAPAFDLRPTARRAYRSRTQQQPWRLCRCPRLPRHLCLQPG